MVKITEKTSNFFLIIGLSLFLLSIFYFYSRSFTYFYSVKTIAKPLFFLFFFSIIFFLIYFSLVEFLEKKISFNLAKLIKVFFCTWLFVQIIKSIFVLPNIILLPDFVEKFFFLKKIISEESFLRLIRFFIPYLICFLIVVKFPTIKFKILRFAKILGYVFFIIVLYDLTEKSLANSYKENKIISNYENNRKVLIFLLDEFDPGIAFSNKNLKFMNNFNSLIEQAFTHSKMYAPAKWTIESVPSILLGKQTKGFIIKDYKYFMKTNDNDLIEWNYKNSLFGKVHNMGINSAVVTSVLNYCEVLRGLNYCRSPSSFYWFLGISEIFSIVKKLKAFDGLFKINLFDKKKTKINNYPEINQIDEYSFKKNIDINDIDGNNIIKINELDDLIKKNENHLYFIHANIPHPPYDYAKDIFKIQSKNDKLNYLINLKLSDIVLKKIIEIFKEYENDKYMYLFISDHWHRIGENKKSRDYYPSLFIAKMSDDNTKIQSSKHSSMYHLGDLIIKFFEGKIESNSDIKNFLEKKEFTEPMINFDIGLPFKN